MRAEQLVIQLEGVLDEEAEDHPAHDHDPDRLTQRDELIRRGESEEAATEDGPIVDAVDEDGATQADQDRGESRALAQLRAADEVAHDSRADRMERHGSESAEQTGEDVAGRVEDVLEQGEAEAGCGHIENAVHHFVEVWLLPDEEKDDEKLHRLLGGGRHHQAVDHSALRVHDVFAQDRSQDVLEDRRRNARRHSEEHDVADRTRWLGALLVPLLEEPEQEQGGKNGKRNGDVHARARSLSGRWRTTS